MPTVPLVSPIDPATPIDALAVDLGRQADRVRARAHALLATAASTDWQSTAAAAFRARIEDLAKQLLQVATRLDDASASTRAHAVEVRGNR